MSNQQYILISGVLFALVSLAHLLRIVFGVSVYVDATVVPMAVSWTGFIVPGAHAYWAFRLNHCSRRCLTSLTGLKFRFFLALIRGFENDHHGKKR